jgi:hypothetical protein
LNEDQDRDTWGLGLASILYSHHGMYNFYRREFHYKLDI